MQRNCRMERLHGKKQLLYIVENEKFITDLFINVYMYFIDICIFRDVFLYRTRVYY